MELSSNSRIPHAVSIVGQASLASHLTMADSTSESDCGYSFGHLMLPATAVQSEEVSTEIASSHVKMRQSVTNSEKSQPSMHRSEMAGLSQVSSPKLKLQYHRSNYAKTQNLIDCVELKAHRNRKSLTCYTSRNIIHFIVPFSVVLCLCAAMTVYMDGVLYDLQQVYFFANSQVHFLGGVDLIGVVITLFIVALFGREAHKPLLIFCGVVICSCGSFICAVPYFIDKTNDDVIRNVNMQTVWSNAESSTFESLQPETNTASSAQGVFSTSQLYSASRNFANQYTDDGAVFRTTSKGM